MCVFRILPFPFFIIKAMRYSFRTQKSRRMTRKSKPCSPATGEVTVSSARNPDGCSPTGRHPHLTCSRRREVVGTMNSCDIAMMAITTRCYIIHITSPPSLSSYSDNTNVLSGDKAPDNCCVSAVDLRVRMRSCNTQTTNSFPGACRDAIILACRYFRVPSVRITAIFNRITS